MSNAIEGDIDFLGVLKLTNWHWIGDFRIIDIETGQLSLAIIDIEVKETIDIEWCLKIIDSLV